jgi:uncharacterized protein (TIGR02996 family)
MPSLGVNEEREGFLHALKLSGRDAELHRVFADWLEEHGEEAQARRYRGWAELCEGKMPFVRVPKGTFWMSEGWQNAQKPVTIDADFELAAYTVTQHQFQALLGFNSSWFSRQGKGKDNVKEISDADLEQFPVEQVSWQGAEAFLAELNVRERGRGWFYRFPTEAEWEYACRAGATSREECAFDFYFDQLPSNDASSHQANFCGNYPAGNASRGPYLDRTCKVGSYQANQLGLYDMHGNVWEWCIGARPPHWLPEGPVPVIRGGSWRSIGRNCCAAHSGIDMENRYNAIGLRVARVSAGA